MGPFIIHKERFLAAGIHFFRAGGLRGAPEKNIYFLGYKNFQGLQNCPLMKKILNKQVLGTLLIQKLTIWVG